ncbi:Transport permease protein OS=Streptomyces fumanus OX=67302 GN=GCM10018772_11470 PE=3 SV=1 [Streptomyces fumanus]
MSSSAHALRDHTTMLRRNLLHARRYPSLTLNILLTPIMLLLLFVYVFGDVMSAGLNGGTADRADYVAYLMPGILMLTVGGTALGIAVSVATDMTEGIIARFRTMAISRSSVLIGHVLGSVIQTLAALVLVLGIGFAIGFRADATPLEWLAAGLVTLFSLAVTWIAVGIGLVSPNAGPGPAGEPAGSDSLASTSARNSAASPATGATARAARAPRAPPSAAPATRGP